jgi:hypothetical protein
VVVVVVVFPSPLAGEGRVRGRCFYIAVAVFLFVVVVVVVFPSPLAGEGVSQSETR